MIAKNLCYIEDMFTNTECFKVVNIDKANNIIYIKEMDIIQDDKGKYSYIVQASKKQPFRYSKEGYNNLCIEFNETGFYFIIKSTDAESTRELCNTFKLKNDMFIYYLCKSLKTLNKYFSNDNLTALMLKNNNYLINYVLDYINKGYIFK